MNQSVTSGIEGVSKMRFAIDTFIPPNLIRMKKNDSLAVSKASTKLLNKL